MWYFVIVALIMGIGFLDVHSTERAKKGLGSRFREKGVFALALMKKFESDWWVLKMTAHVLVSAAICLFHYVFGFGVLLAMAFFAAQGYVVVRNYRLV